MSRAPRRRQAPALLAGLAIATAAVAALALDGCGQEEGPPPRAPGSAGRRSPTGEVEPQAMGTSHDSGLDKPPEGAGGIETEKQVRPPPAFRFEDATVEAGLKDCVNHSGKAGVKEYLLEAVGPGPAVLDFDHDGWMDLYVPDGDVFENYDLVHALDPADPTKTRPELKPKDPKPSPHRDRLFRNLGNGRFEDVTDRAGIADDRWSFGALAFDYDGDGWTDVFVANFGKCRLWHNNGNGTFTDVAESVGLAGDPTMWNTCATCGDYDGDGWLDLYVARYADPAQEVERQRKARNLPVGTSAAEIPGRSCKWRGIDAYCGPVGLKAQFDSLYRRQEDGTYRDVTEQVHMVPKAAKYAFTSYFVDYDQDGLPDVFVADDSEENFLWRQSRDAEGRITFEDVSERTGVKYGQQQNAQASMGSTTADINQDGLLDLFVTNFSHDYNNIFLGHRYAGGVSFKDRGLQIMGQAVFYDLSWGCGWYDFDLDGDLDLMIANGHVYKEIDIFEKTGTSYEQYPAVFECLDAKNLKYREVGPKPFKGPNARPPAWLKYEDVYAGAGLEVKKCNRGLTFLDYDNDGDVDAILWGLNDTPTVLRNDLAHGPDRRWLKIALRTEGGNREGIGALVRVTTAGGPTQTFPVFRCQSFLGTDDPRIPVGVGKAEKATVTVTWPGPERRTSTFADLPTNAGWILHADGKAEPMPLPQRK